MNGGQTYSDLEITFVIFGFVAICTFFFSVGANIVGAKDLMMKAQEFALDISAICVACVVLHIFFYIGDRLVNRSKSKDA